jgi:phytoene desaturase
MGIAARIASSSTPASPCKVTLLEKNSRDLLGGRCGSFDVTVSGHDGAFRHERGPSLLLLKSVYEDLFTDCTGGARTAKDYDLDIVQCTPAYQVVFDDGDRIELGYSGNDSQECIDKMNSYEEGGHDKWRQYMAACSAFLDCGLPNFIEERLNLPSFPAFIYEALRDGGKAWPLKPHSDVLDAIFASQKMKALASFQDLYVGLEPYRNDDQLFGGVLRKTAPAVFGLLAALELHPSNKRAGVFAPIGGFRAVANAFERLCVDCDVEIRCDTTVTQVEDDGVHFTSGNAATSDFIKADAVVINADLPYATESLLGGSASFRDNSSAAACRLKDTFDWDDSFDFSSGVVAFHWSLAAPCHDLNTHNVFLSASSERAAVQSWTAVRENIRASMASASDDDVPFNFYVHRASKTDETAAPAGTDSIMVLVPCETLKRRKEYANLDRDEAIAKYKEQFSDEYVDTVRRAVLQRLGKIPSLLDLDSKIIDEVVDTPATYSDYYNLGGGTPFALSHGFAQLSLTRPSPRYRKRRNTFFVGASTRPGNGVPLVLLGAKAIAGQVMNNIASREDESGKS